MDLVPVARGDAGGGLRRFATTEAARQLMQIETAPVERRFVEAEVRMVGKIEYDETRLAYITAWVPGRLDRLFVDYTGVPVRTGDHLVYMYSPELLSAQEELLQALEAVRNLEGSDVGIVRETARATVEAAREKLRLWGLTKEQVEAIEQRGTPSDHMTIYAPIGGIVVHKNALEGMYVDTGTRIYTIADLSQVWVKLDAYESDLAWLKYGQPITFTTVAYPGEQFSGTIAFIDPVLNEQTRTVKVRVNAPNPDGRLRPGMFVRAVARAKVAEGGRVMDPDLAGKWICPMHPDVVKAGAGDCDICGMPLVRTESLGYVPVDPAKREAPLVIPATAPLLTGTRAVVYRVVPDTEKPTYEGLEIVLGPRAGDWYVVRGGLEEGDLVVTNGNFKIDSQLQIEARPSMMMPEGEARPAAEPLPDAVRRALAGVYAAYLEAQTALAQDDHAGAGAAAKALRAAVEAVPSEQFPDDDRDIWAAHAAELGEAAATMGGAENIEAARRAFALVSESLAALADRFGSPMEGPLYRLHCPMAFSNRGADWLQPDTAVRNPYFGSAMPTCGEVQAVYEPAGAPAEGGHAHD
jgi:Cu(I)/Ag(I) efflux system membrane fusion protein